MSLALLALLALVVAVALSVVRSDLNAGVVSIGFTFILGILGLGLTAAEIGGFFPTSLVLTLTGVTLLFEMARENGTLDRLAGYAFRAVGGRPSLLPIAVFFLTFGLAAIGLGNIAATALMAPVAMTAAERVGVRRILMAIAVCSGANAGAFSPVALTGLINANLMARIGVGDAGLSFAVFLVVAALQSLNVVSAYVLLAE